MVSVRTSIVPPGPRPLPADTPGTSAPITTPQVTASLHDFAVSLTADPTPYVHEVIAGARESGRIIGVVSNNSPRAVNAYLDRHGLTDGIALVVARTSHDPALLKPNPHLINETISALEAHSFAAALVGDSFTDIEAAHSAGVDSIGYANKPGKRKRMIELRAGAVITSMAELALSLRAHAASPEP